MKIHNTYISYAFGNHSLESNEEIAIQSIERQHVMLICLATSLFTCFHSFGGFFSKTGCGIRAFMLDLK